MTDAAYEFDPLLLSQVRLGIVTILMNRGTAAFPELKALLGVTAGNLGAHLGKLEEGGYVRVDKTFSDRRPRTTARLTAAGKRAFLAHVRRLGEIAGDPPE